MMGCKNRAVTGSWEQFEARGAIKTAIWSRTYTNTGGIQGWLEAGEQWRHGLLRVERQESGGDKRKEGRNRWQMKAKKVKRAGAERRKKTTFHESWEILSGEVMCKFRWDWCSLLISGLWSEITRQPVSSPSHMFRLIVVLALCQKTSTHNIQLR